jgi:hypothetical protein
VVEAVARAESGVAQMTEHPLVFRDPVQSKRLAALSHTPE